jgi:phospholipid/cholesterol/gamma-HCH transport system substrate-binding protein
MARRFLPIGAVAAVVVVAIIVISAASGGSSHTLKAEFTSAEQLAPGLEVRLAGRKVGDIASVKLVNRLPVVTLEISENDVWPLPTGTTAEQRWGSTTSLEYRYVELHPGPQGATPLADGAQLGPAHTVTAVELDSFYRIFRGRTNADLRKLVAGLGDTLGTAGPALRSGLANAPGGLDQTSSVLAELGADQNALAQLITQGNNVTSALSARQADLGPLLDHASATLDELANHATSQQQALDRAPAALDAGSSTLSRLDTSLTGLQTLVDNIAPGAIGLRRLAPIAKSALVELNHIAPVATSALKRGTDAAGPLTQLLKVGTPFLPKAGSAVGQLAPMVSCLLPYSPELAGTLSTWSGFNQNYDSGGHYARTFDLTANPYIVAGTSYSSHQVTQLTSGLLTYAMPRPPGLNAGQPFLAPQCDAGPSALDASQDPEGNGS